MKTDRIVQKFGGTSVGSVDRIKAVANRIIESKSHFKHVVVVVSAMGDTTDALAQKAREITDTPSPREYDALLSTGENMSAALVAMAINHQGHEAISLTGGQAKILTEPHHNHAKILEIDTRRIEQELDQGKIVIVTGFQGINEYNDVTTIGRGGSDTSAVALASALKCQTCEIYTDVAGIYTTDPRIEKSARKLASISYDEMLDLASLGAKVLHPRAVECAKENQIELHVRSSFNQEKGTLVKEVNIMEINKPVTGIAVNKEEAIISLMKLPDEPGIAGQIFTQLADARINVDMIIQSAEEDENNNISFSIHESDLDRTTALSQEIVQKIGAETVLIDNSIAKISIVGVGMISKPGVAAKMFQTLGNAGINIKRISTSEIKISCAITRDKAHEAVRLLHQAFELDSAV